MNDRLRDLLAWLDDRTAFRTSRHHLLDEPLPPGTGWWFTLGSVLLFGLGVQVVTGIALALFYAPTPDHAWESVRFITTMIPGGHVLRGLHHWGASVVVVAALVHLVRVVFFGSYRKPRELNWIAGLILLQVDPRVRAHRLPAAVGSALRTGRRSSRSTSPSSRRSWARAWPRSCAAGRTWAR